MSRPGLAAEPAFAQGSGASPLEAARSFLARLGAKDRVLVAISGGSDSTGLLHALHVEAQKVGLPKGFLVAATIDHGLRAESADEAALVTSYCESLGIEHHIRRWGGEKPNTGLMAAARAVRYRLLGEIAAEVSASLTVTGHTLDDQLETVAMRATRGDPGRGLAGMACLTLFDGNLWVARPFLDVKREAIRQLLKQIDIGWTDDPSNENSAYERIRVRKVGTGDISPEDIRMAGMERLKQSTDAAILIERLVECPADGCFRMPADKAKGKTGQLVVKLLAAVAGGQSYLPPEDKAKKLFSAIEAGDGFRMTLSRAIVESRHGVLFVYREKRNLPRLILETGKSAVWDERFRVTNGGPEAVSVGFWGDSAVAREPRLPEDLPPGIGRRVSAVLPFAGSSGNGGIQCKQYLAPFESVLPGFDFAMAQKLAMVAGRAPFPSPPFDL